MKTEEVDFETQQEVNSEKKDTTETSSTVNENFVKVMTDFIHDLSTTFPEYKEKLSIYIDEENRLIAQPLFDHCKKVYPERFFDFLYKNEDIVNDENINTEFLPTIDLQDIWSMTDITDSMKETIWKYLQLLLFSIIDNVEDKSVFGATSELFENVNEEEFKTKMEDTMKDLFELFQQNQSNDDEDESNSEQDTQTTPEFLNPDNMQDHISSLLDGKLGKLATEIAEETAKELDLDMNDAENSEDAIKNLVSNPNKLMKLVKKVGGKLENKIKSGDIKESELMEEASQIMKKMKGMPGMNNMEKMFQGMGGMGGGGMPDLSALSALAGKGAKINTGAYNNMARKQEAIERARKRAQETAERRRKEKEAKEDMERKRQEYFQNTDHEAEIEKLMKSLEESDEPVKKSGKKKKKKKAKQSVKSPSNDATPVESN